MQKSSILIDLPFHCSGMKQNHEFALHYNFLANAFNYGDKLNNVSQRCAYLGLSLV